MWRAGGVPPLPRIFVSPATLVGQRRGSQTKGSVLCINQRGEMMKCWLIFLSFFFFNPLGRREGRTWCDVSCDADRRPVTLTRTVRALPRKAHEALFSGRVRYAATSLSPICLSRPMWMCPAPNMVVCSFYTWTIDVRPTCWMSTCDRPRRKVVAHWSRREVEGAGSNASR